MALSFKEKNQLRASISDFIAALGTQGVSFKEKGALRQQIADALAKLNEQIDLKPDTAGQNLKLADLIAGKFNDEEPVRFLKILKEITDEIQSVDPVKEPTIKYIELKKAA